MIHYDTKHHIGSTIFRREGSVLPRALFWSVPAALAAIGFGLIKQTFMPEAGFSNASSAWASYNFTVGFLVVFRTQQAHSRFWEGATLLHKVRGEWVNAVSSLFAFCTANDNLQDDVLKFQHLVVRLMSLMFCKALQRVADLKNEDFPIIDLQGFDPDALRHLRDTKQHCEVILQWVQRLIVQNISNGVLPIAPPILSRVFQELSQGIVSLHEAEKIAIVLFPFPYAQMMHLLLLVNTFISPIVTAAWTEWYWAGLLTFVCVSSLWAINYIALEIERPFGDDPNDLPIQFIMEEMNRALSTLTETRTQCPPAFDFHPDIHVNCKRELCSKATGLNMDEATLMWSVSLAEEAAKDNEDIRVESLKLKERLIREMRAQSKRQDRLTMRSSQNLDVVVHSSSVTPRSMDSKLSDNLAGDGQRQSLDAEELPGEEPILAERECSCAGTTCRLVKASPDQKRRKCSLCSAAAAPIVCLGCGAGFCTVCAFQSSAAEHTQQAAGCSDVPCASLSSTFRQKGASGPAALREGHVPVIVARAPGHPLTGGCHGVPRRPGEQALQERTKIDNSGPKGPRDEAHQGDAIVPSMFVLPADDPPSQNTDFPGGLVSPAARKAAGVAGAVGALNESISRHLGR